MTCPGYTIALRRLFVKEQGLVEVKVLLIRILLFHYWCPCQSNLKISEVIEVIGGNWWCSLCLHLKKLGFCGLSAIADEQCGQTFLSMKVIQTTFSLNDGYASAMQRSQVIISSRESLGSH